MAENIAEAENLMKTRTGSPLDVLSHHWRCIISMVLGLAVVVTAVVQLVTILLDQYRTDAILYLSLCVVILFLLVVTASSISPPKRGQRPWSDPCTWIVLSLLIGGPFAAPKVFDHLVAAGMMENPVIARERDDQIARRERQIQMAEAAAAAQADQRTAASRGLFVQLGSANGITVYRDSKTGCEWIVGADGHPVKREKKDDQGRDIWVCDAEVAS